MKNEEIKQLGDEGAERDDESERRDPGVNSGIQSNMVGSKIKEVIEKKLDLGDEEACREVVLESFERDLKEFYECNKWLKYGRLEIEEMAGKLFAESGGKLSEREILSGLRSAQITFLVDEITNSVLKGGPMSLGDVEASLRNILKDEEKIVSFVELYRGILEQVENEAEVLASNESVGEIFGRHAEGEEADYTLKRAFEAMQRLDNDQLQCDGVEAVDVIEPEQEFEGQFIPARTYKFIKKMPLLRTVKMPLLDIVFYQKYTNIEKPDRQTGYTIIDKNGEYMELYDGLDIFMGDNLGYASSHPDKHGRFMVLSNIFPKDRNDKEMDPMTIVDHELRHAVNRHLFPKVHGAGVKLSVKSAEDDGKVHEAFELADNYLLDEFIAHAFSNTFSAFGDYIIMMNTKVVQVFRAYGMFDVDSVDTPENMIGDHFLKWRELNKLALEMGEKYLEKEEKRLIYSFIGVSSNLEELSVNLRKADVLVGCLKGGA